MRNSILKSYLRKFIRSEAFVSVIIVFVLAIGIIGTSYALYMDVDTDTDYQLVEVGDLSVGFDNGESTFTLNYLTPTDDDIATGKIESDIASEVSKNNLFSFYIYNNGNYTANYNIKLVPQEGSISSEYLKYQICKDNSENCKDINVLSEAENNVIFNDELSPNRTDSQTNPSAYYFIRVWVKSDYTVKENDKVVLKVEIDAKNASGYLDNDNTLVGKLLSDDRVKINNTVPKFDGIADYVETGDESSGELGLFKAEDDYGISYYYRGAQSYNYVLLDNNLWRIVRIMGDGRIKLILDTPVNDINTILLSNTINKYLTFVDECEQDLTNTFDVNGNNIIFDNDSTKNYYSDLYVRLYLEKTPTLKCDTTKNTKADYFDLITPDEVLLAGGGLYENNSFYLVDNDSADYFKIKYSFVYYQGEQQIIGVLSNGNFVINSDSTNNWTNITNKPVIYLKNDVLYKTGDGTSETPYEIK